MAVENVIDNETPAEPYGKGDEFLLPEKKLLVGIGLLLTGGSGAMAFTSAVNFKAMQDNINFFENGKNEVPFALLAFRVVMIALIALGFIQLLANLILTIILLKEKVSMIYRLNSPFTIASSVMCGAFWLLVLSIFIYEMQFRTGVWLGVALFVGGFLHAGVIIYYFITIETQKRMLLETEDDTQIDGSVYRKF